MHISTGNGVGCEAFRLSGFTTPSKPQIFWSNMGKELNEGYPFAILWYFIFW